MHHNSAAYLRKKPNDFIVSANRMEKKTRQKLHVRGQSKVNYEMYLRSAVMANVKLFKGGTSVFVKHKLCWKNQEVTIGSPL